MLKSYAIVGGRVVETQDPGASVLVFSNPNDAERQRLLKEFCVDEHNLASSLDPDEPSRVEFGPDSIALIVKRPKNYSAPDQFVFRVASMGMFLCRDRLVVVISEDIPLFVDKHFAPVQTLHEVFLRLLYGSVTHFHEHLKVINAISEEIEQKINVSMENLHLLNLFSLEKSLVYYLSAIHSNGVAFEKLRTGGARIGFSDSHQALLDDLLIENSQSYRQAEIYSSILASLMDARVSIVSNNLNILMKNLNAVVISVAVPSFFAGLGGMSEFSAVTGIDNWKLAYPLFILAMAAVGVLTFAIIKRVERH